MIADVAFDAPIAHPFSYRVPEGWTLACGQRVVAPLKGGSRVGVVVGLREGADERLKLVLRVVDAAPRLSPEQLDTIGWIAAESLTSFGSTCLGLLPPPEAPPPREQGHSERSAERSARRDVPAPPAPTLLVGSGREGRLLELIAAAATPTLVLASDVDTAARWAQRLAKIGPVVRLDSGVTDAERATAWTRLAANAATLAVGTRSALLAPLPAGATLAVIDEHEAAHKPPGPPRMHAREVTLERARREGLHALFTSATPSVEMWWRTEGGGTRAAAGRAGPWPAVTVADTRGIARREALTPVLARAIRENLAAGRRVFLVVGRLSSALGCDECGAILRCPACAIALAYSPAGRTLACRLCAATAALPETCVSCGGRRLAPFGWGAERVEHAVRRRFARARIVRYDPEAARTRQAESQRAAALAADVVIGTRGALKLFGPASLGLVGFVSPDQMLGVPDFRAAERAFGLLWAAAERVRADGALVVQSQNPTHYAVAAVAQQELAAFYAPELKFRAELGYPPFQRLALITARGPDPATAQRMAHAVTAALSGNAGLTVYPPMPDRRGRAQRIVVKGPTDLPRTLADALQRLGSPRSAKSRGIIDVEVDPVEWLF